VKVSRSAPHQISAFNESARTITSPALNRKPLRTPAGSTRAHHPPHGRRVGVGHTDCAATDRWPCCARSAPTPGRTAARAYSRRSSAGAPCLERHLEGGVAIFKPPRSAMSSPSVSRPCTCVAESTTVVGIELVDHALRARLEARGVRRVTSRAGCPGRRTAALIAKPCVISWPITAPMPP